MREVAFESSVTSIDALKKAAYRYIDRFSLELLTKKSTYVCLLKFKSELSEEIKDQFVDDFRKEVLDQELRASINTETEQVRNLILAHAFSKTGVIKNE